MTVYTMDGTMGRTANGSSFLRGFTLLEVMTFVAVIAILSAIAVLSFNTGLDRIRVNSGVRTISYALNYARIRAIAENRPYVVKFVVRGPTTVSGRICVLETFCDANKNQVQDPGEVIHEEELPKGIIYDLTAVKDIYDRFATSPEQRDGIDFPEDQVIFFPRGNASTRGEVYIVPSSNLKDTYNGNRKAVSLEAISGKTIVWNYYEGLEKNGQCPWKEDGR
jgi:prepilin-type N-terminal cleavage/methylation domain-containing protein